MSEVSETIRIQHIMAEQTEELRHSVLWPAMPLDYVRLEEDKDGQHFGAFVPSQDQPVAVISVFLQPIPSGAETNQSSGETLQQANSARFRKFACHPDFQGRGIGTKLLSFIVPTCSRMGAKVIWCDARLSTSKWYEKRGFIRFGDPFFKESVEYTRMKMDLVNTEAG
ncbi:hypothetical protein HYDPIDRAFT_31602 [Hydnomerulius pinastri MD-312]|uniref:N-acetyltransferase domain-containing protein n=1 Tax=Hydnomerulius pinastri MD-312 TaxID=994086 RepID=A0A0C9VT47_9AGAM|nr:hypothetical protein HYDPIDRAFT_31602 [Hydnomerulius pinastri MD-312]